MELSERGISQLSKFDSLAKALEQLERLSNSSANVEEGQESAGMVEARRLADLARSEMKTGFRLLHGHSLVGVWAALEVMARDTVVAWLVNVPETIANEPFASVKFTVGEFEQLERSERMSVLVDEVDRKRGGQGVGRFEHLLDAAGLSGSAPKRVRDRLFELQQIRHVFAHRGGEADRALVDACPALKLKVGRPVQLPSKTYLHYLTASWIYAVILSNRIRAQFGVEEVKVPPLPRRPKN